ncbi:MAG: hypothetical protein WDN30_16635 [Pararobbsia sp.]
MTLLLLDTNAYLRFAKRIKPLLGVAFGAKKYTLTVLSIVEEEFHRSVRLQERFPWFDDDPLAGERLAKQVRLSATEREQLMMRFERCSRPGRSTRFSSESFMQP